MKKNKSTISLLLVFCMIMSITLSFKPVTASAQVAGHVVISEAYGGGGNSGAQYKNDFIELYNPTADDVNLASWSVQYASATGTTYTSYTIATGTIKAGGFFLIQAAAGTGGTVNLPTPDATCTFTMSGTGFKVKLVDTASITIDLVGASTTASEFETAVAPAPSNTTSIQRKDNSGGQTEVSGGWDTDNNSLDFYTLAPTPKNSTFGFETAAAIPTANPSSGAVRVGKVITLSTATAGATITYQLNGGAETEYTGSITLDQDKFVDGIATIQAKASKAGLTTSQAVTFAYNTNTITAQAAKALPSGSIVRVKGIVTYSTQGRTIFMQDATGGICVDSGSSSTDISTNVGKEIDVIGTIGLYGNMVQIIPASTTDIEVTNATPTIPEPLVVTINQLNNSNRVYEGKLIKVENAQIKTISVGTTSLFNHVIMQGSDEITLRAGVLTGRTVNEFITLTGIAGFYTTPQIQANVSDIVNGVAPAVQSVTANPATGNSLPIGGTVTLSTATADATITYTLNGDTEQTIAGNSGTVVINEFNQPEGKAIIKARATKSDSSSSETTFTYTQTKTNAVTANLVGAVSGISQITLTAAENATIRFIVTKKAGIDGESSDPEAEYTAPIQITEEMLPAKITAFATMNGYLQSDNATFTYYLASNLPYKNYFGQLHSHTTNSDGAGSLEEAFTYARDTAKLDFFAVTDHSNSYDKASAGDKAGTYNLNAYNASNQAWINGQTAAANSSKPNFTGIYGFEMTWSGGPGHINTFNTQGFVSRNNTELNNKTGDAGMKAYYELLKKTPESISQFNHPGTTFGNFSNFAYYDPIIDKQIKLIEVGNGEGAVGSGGYFPSYEQYTMALDKGWHVAPSNNQDNHKKGWGTSNTNRTVVWTNDLSASGIFQAISNLKVYATEVSNLDITYKLNDSTLGSILDSVPGAAHFTASIKNPTSGNIVKSVSIITNGGMEIGKRDFNTQNVDYDWTLNVPEPGYYYLRVVDLVNGQERYAVTAPVWLGKAESVGITEVKKSTDLPVTTEEMTLTTSLFNNETSPATLTAINYKLKDGTTLFTETPNTDILANGGTLTHSMKYTPAVAGDTTVMVTATILLNGKTKDFTYEINYSVTDINKVTFIGIDGSHYNEYVAGNYKDNMGNFTKLAAASGVRTVTLNNSTDLIGACSNPKYKTLLLTAPTRRLTGITYSYYSDAEIAAITAFASNGGTVIISGWSDIYECPPAAPNAPTGLNNQMAWEQNKLLRAIGSSLRLGDDASVDEILNPPNNQYRLYLPNTFNPNNSLTDGVVPQQTYSVYGGSTVYAVDKNDNPVNTLPLSVSPIINGLKTTWSEDRDKDGYGLNDPSIKLPRYGNGDDVGRGTGTTLLNASEIVDHGGKSSLVIVSGGAFMSNFEIQVDVDNAGTLPYSNYTILSNIIKAAAPIVQITSIADAKNLPDGTNVVIEATATSEVNTQSINADTNKGFFDCIYAQDATGGINLFPVASGIKEGQKARFYGKVSHYQGEVQLAVSKTTILDQEINKLEPNTLATKNSMLPTNTGLLVKTQGVVSDINKDIDGTINQFTINDGTGPAIVFINGYITKGTTLPFVTDGATVSVVGLASIGEVVNDSNMHARIRVRDRSEIVIAKAPPVITVPPVIVPNPTIQRLAGLDRIETSIAIAKELYTNRSADAVVLATANNFPDALAGSGLAYKYNAPLLLVNKTVNDSKNVLDYITTTIYKNRNIYILGGTGVVSEEISEYLRVQGYNVIRLGGKDRYETNQEIVNYLNTPKGTSIVIATGANFADALSVSSIAGIKGFPVLLNSKDNLSASVSNDIINIHPTTVYLIGGTGVLSTNIETQIKNLNGKITIVRLGGKDRYETSMNIMEYFNLTTTTVAVATGLDFPDALSGSVLAARKNSAVLLLDNKDVSKQKELLNKQKIINVIVFGGEGVISKAIATSLIE